MRRDGSWRIGRRLVFDGGAMPIAVAKGKRIVDELGICLVYPITNAADPPSLWSRMHPRTPMRWDWSDDGADRRVVEVWHLKNALARTGDVAYAKWFRGRATFFSLDVFHATLARLAEAGDVFAGLPREARDLLSLLRERSPLSTKELRAEVGLRGKPFERVFTHAMRALWQRLLIVGIGEVDDGTAMPPLQVSATEAMFEDVWNARTAASDAQRVALDAVLAGSRAWRREFERGIAAVRDATSGSSSDDEDQEDIARDQRCRRSP
jgi:hypothetical protein